MSHYNPDPESHGNVLCSMVSGVELNPTICDVLLFNAADMVDCRRTSQQIKGRNYDGFITSNLDVFEHPGGFPVVEFFATVATGKWQAGTVRFCIRTDNLDSLQMNRRTWGRVMLNVMGIRLPDGIEPEDAYDAIQRGEGIPIHPDCIPPEIREQIERGIMRMELGMTPPDADDDDNEEWDTGEPTYG